MRIVLSCLQSLRRHHVPAYDFWRPHFVNGCEEAGIEYLEVADVDWAEGLVHGVGPELNAWKARTWDRVMTFVRKEHARHPIDAFLGYLYPRLVDTGCIDDIQRLGIPCVNFFCDNVREFVEVPRAYRPFALHWVPEYEALPMYRKAGLAHLHAPMPCWVPPALRTVPAVATDDERPAPAVVAATTVDGMAWRSMLIEPLA